jgi:glycosyltransferase involved in cell wall biosynthesis
VLEQAPHALSFDLVVATVGRVDELRRFLESVLEQSYPSVRVILVDQSDDDRVAGVIGDFADRLDLLRLCSKPGLSRARNVGLREVDADVVAFPDDDCRYPAGLLWGVARDFETTPQRDVVSVRSVDESGRPSNMRWDTDGGQVTRFNVWKRAISYTVFLRRSAVNAVGAFDERLGAGAGTRFGSGEETDYLLRMLATGRTMHYDPALNVVHRHVGAGGRARAYDYGVGQGHVLRRHGYPWWFAGWRCGQLVMASAWLLVTGRFSQAGFFGAMACGRARGWFATSASGLRQG